MCILEDVANECAGSMCAVVGVRLLWFESGDLDSGFLCWLFYFSFTD